MRARLENNEISERDHFKTWQFLNGLLTIYHFLMDMFLLISYNIIEDSFGKIHWINVSASICVCYWLVDKHLRTYFIVLESFNI